MASKYLLITLLLLAVALNFSASRAVNRGVPQVIHIINTLKSPFSVRIKVKENTKFFAEVKPGQDYLISVDDNSVNYEAIAFYGSKTAPFVAFSPGRDLDEPAVYWKADDYGFSFSHDNVHYEKLAPWQSL